MTRPPARERQSFTHASHPSESGAICDARARCGISAWQGFGGLFFLHTACSPTDRDALEQGHAHLVDGVLIKPSSAADVLAEYAKYRRAGEKLDERALHSLAVDVEACTSSLSPERARQLAHKIHGKCAYIDGAAMLANAAKRVKLTPDATSLARLRSTLNRIVFFHRAAPAADDKAAETAKP